MYGVWHYIEYTLTASGREAASLKDECQYPIPLRLSTYLFGEVRHRERFVKHPQLA